MFFACNSSVCFAFFKLFEYWIFCNSKERPLIVDFIQELESENIFDDKIVTEVNNIKDFYTAEEYHHDYFAKNPTNAYCQAVINPKIVKLKSNFSNLISE